MKKIEVNITKEEFEHLYYDEQLSQQDIADRLGVTINPIIRLMKEFNIIHRDSKDVSQIANQTKSEKNIYKDIPLSKNELYDLYVNQNLCPLHIATLYNLDVKLVSRIVENMGYKKDRTTVDQSVATYRKTFNIQVGPKPGVKRGPYSKPSPFKIDLDQDKLKELINDNNYTIKDIAKYFNVSISVINSRIHEYGLTRTADELKMRRLKTLNKRYNISQEVRGIIDDKDKFRQFVIDNNLTTVQTIASALDLANTTVCRYVNLYDMRDIVKASSNSSYAELEIKNYLNSLGIDGDKNKTILSPQEIDLYYPDYNIGIEYNGDYWHSDLKKSKNYHFDKSKECDLLGIHLIHIYENEWTNPRIRPILESYLKITFGKVENRIYARNCEIREITNAEAKPFNDANHLQGHRNAQVTYGLFYQDKLVQLMSFSYDKKHSWWEIIRGCPGSNNVVIGGVSKLFTHFVREYNPEKIFSYCDYNKFDGHGYEALGMKFIGFTGPNMSWLMPNGDVIPRSPSRHKELKETAVAKIWGAGSKKYLWINPNFEIENN